jgi:hypothetical protein
MLSRERSALAAASLRQLPHLNADRRVLLQVLGMDMIGQSDFCNGLTLSNDALIVSELNPPPALPRAARLSMSEQALQLLAASTAKQPDAAA